MGVCFHATGLPYSQSYDCGYLSFNNYRCKLAQKISPLAGVIYTGWLWGANGSYSDENGQKHNDGCTLSIPFHEYDELAEQLNLAYPDDRRKARKALDEKGELLFQEKIGALEEKGLFAFELDPGIPTMTQTTIKCAGKYDDLDKCLEEAFGPVVCGFLFAPDTEGRLSWKDCRALYQELSPYSLDLQGHNYSECKTVRRESGGYDVDVRHYNMHDQFLGMFKHCWKRRVNLYWN